MRAKRGPESRRTTPQKEANCRCRDKFPDFGVYDWLDRPGYIMFSKLTNPQNNESNICILKQE